MTIYTNDLESHIEKLQSLFEEDSNVYKDLSIIASQSKELSDKVISHETQIYDLNTRLQIIIDILRQQSSDLLTTQSSLSSKLYGLDDII